MNYFCLWFCFQNYSEIILWKNETLWDIIRDKSWEEMSSQGSQALFQQIRFSAFWPFSQDCNRLVCLCYDYCASSLSQWKFFSQNISSLSLFTYIFSLYRFCWWHSFRKLSGREYCTCSSRSTEFVILLGEGESRPKEYAGLSWSSSLKLEQKLTRGASVVMGKLSPEKNILRVKV